MKEMIGRTCSELERELPGFWMQALKHLSDNFFLKDKENGEQNFHWKENFLLEVIPEHFVMLIVVEQMP